MRPARIMEENIHQRGIRKLPGSRNRLLRHGLFALLMLILSGSAGCISRRMTIRSEPAGALVYVDGKEVGYTPCSIDFTYYGKREVTLVKDGFETLTAIQPLRTPWYQVPPLDFATDNFLLSHHTDRHEFFYKLEPQRVVGTQELLDRANSFRSESQIGR